MEYALFLIIGLVLGYAGSIISVKTGSKISKESITPFVYSPEKKKDDGQPESDESIPYDWEKAEEYMQTEPPWEEEEYANPKDEDFEKVNEA